MTLFPISAKSQAYVDGFKSGRADRRLGIRSDYAFYGVNDSNEYTRNYSEGYRRGILGLVIWSSGRRRRGHNCQISGCRGSHRSHPA